MYGVKKNTVCNTCEKKQKKKKKKKVLFFDENTYNIHTTKY